jgi:CelD/BcsL family acetyltransferase involved in cellulose biosynthesis
VVLEQIPEDPELRRRWNELVQGMDHPEVFYTYDWALSVQRAYGSALRPLVFLAYEDEVLEGIVALAREKDELQSVVFLTGTTADYCDFLSEPGARRDFVSEVFSELRKREVRKIVLANLPGDSASAEAISGVASTCRYHLLSRPAYLCARVSLGSVEERAALKQATLGKKMLRRQLREMEKEASLVVRHDTGWQQIEPALQSFARAHVARFLATGRVSNLVRAERRLFLHELARELSRSGWITLSRLLIGQTPVAWNYGFRFAGSWFWYQPTFDSRYEDFSPGFCLLAKIVEAACDHPEVNIVDLGLGAEGYKERFATSNSQTLHLTLNRSLSSHFRAVVRNHAAAVAKASPRVEGWIRKVMGYGARVRMHLRETGTRGWFSWFGHRIWRSLVSIDEVHFFDWPNAGIDPKRSRSLALRPLDFDLLGAAGIHYADEPSTLDYLVRSAQRLRSGDKQGFALVTTDGTPVHFCWVGDFEGFAMAELQRALQAPCVNAVLIFDCHTPASVRGHGFFADAISILADQFRGAGKRPWIFAAATNHASLRGIEKSGFTRRFSLGRRRILFLKTEKDSVPSADTANIAAAA